MYVHFARLKTFKEWSETLDELSHETLKSYADKAERDAEHHG